MHTYTERTRLTHTHTHIHTEHGICPYLKGNSMNRLHIFRETYVPSIVIIDFYMYIRLIRKKFRGRI